MESSEDYKRHLESDIRKVTGFLGLKPSTGDQGREDLYCRLHRQLATLQGPGYMGIRRIKYGHRV